MPTNPTREETTDIAPVVPTWEDTSETPPINRALERENLAREMRQARAEGLGAKALSGLANVGERAAYTISLMDPLTAVGRLINPYQQSALPQEAVRAAIDYLDPFSQANVVPGSAIEGAKQFGSELVSGLAQPEAVGALMTGRLNPQLPGRLFQPSLIKGSQQAAANLAQSETPTEAVKSALELGLTAGGTAGIEAHAARAGRPIPTDLAERPVPVTGRTLRQPEGAKPPTEARQAQLAAEEALPPTEELAAPPTTKLSPEAESAVAEAEIAPSVAEKVGVAEVSPSDVKEGDTIRWEPTNENKRIRYEPVEGIVRDVIKNQEGEIGFHILSPQEGDPGNVVRVWANRGKVVSREPSKLEEKPKVETIRPESISETGSAKRPKTVVEIADEIAARGVDPQASYGQFVKARDLKPEISAKEWLPIYRQSLELHKLKQAAEVSRKQQPAPPTAPPEAIPEAKPVEPKSEVKAEAPSVSGAAIPALFVKYGQRMRQVTPKEASAMMDEMRQKTGLGASKLPPLPIYDVNGNEIGHVSYNGNVWLGEASASMRDLELLYNKTGLVRSDKYGWDLPKRKGWDELRDVQDKLMAIRERSKAFGDDAGLAAKNPEFAKLILQRDRLLQDMYGKGGEPVEISATSKPAASAPAVAEISTRQNKTIPLDNNANVLLSAVPENISTFTGNHHLLRQALKYDGPPLAVAEGDNYIVRIVPSGGVGFGKGIIVVESKQKPGFPVVTGSWMDQWEPYMKQNYDVSKSGYARAPETKRAEMEAWQQLSHWLEGKKMDVFPEHFARTYYPDEWQAWMDANVRPSKTLKGFQESPFWSKKSIEHWKKRFFSERTTEPTPAPEAPAKMTLEEAHRIIKEHEARTKELADFLRASDSAQTKMMIASRSGYEPNFTPQEKAIADAIEKAGGEVPDDFGPPGNTYEQTKLYKKALERVGRAETWVPPEPPKPEAPAEATKPPFMDWRIQGISARHSKVGEKLTREQADQIIAGMAERGMRGRYDEKKGTVVLNSGMLDDFVNYWREAGSYAKKEQARQEVKSERKAREEQRDVETKDALAKNPATNWIDDTFGADALNDYNKLALARFLTGEATKFEGIMNWKWKEGLEKLGALSPEGKVDFGRIKKAFSEKETEGTPPLEPGPGAQTVGEPKYAAIAQLTDQLNAAPPLGAKEKLAWRERAADAWAQGKSALEKAFAKTESIKTTLREMQRGVREITDLDRRVASLDYLLQRSAGQSRANGKAIQRAVRNKPMREAIAIWIDSGGDTAAIQSVLDNLPKGIRGSVRRALQRAVDLPSEAKQIAEQFKQFFGIREQDALQAEIFEKGLEDYYSHIWEKAENMPDKLRTAITNGKVSDYFQFARQRKIPTFLEGIAQGKNPILDPAKVLPYYNYALDRAIASREFIKSLSDLQAPDGLPAVLPTGTASVIEAGEAGRTNGAMLINPRGKRLGIVKKGIETEEEANAIAEANKLRVVPDPSDPTKFAVRYPIGEDLKYRLIDHPAMRKWKWIGTNENGDPIMYKSDLAVHPLLYKRLARMMDRGLLTPTEWGRRALRFSSEIKAIKLAAFPSMFHQVHVGSHALWHWTNPFKTAEINWDSPATKFAIEKGHLKLAADPQELANFSEGVLGPGLIHKVPMIGPISRGYSEWLFGDYIPRLKLKTFENAYERNLKWYAKDIQKGKVTPEEIASRVGDSINNAYGELNHLFLGKYGRDPRFQRLLRGIFLAPDFGEARLRFTEKALTKFGHEEHVAFATMVITMYMAARIANVISHGDPEWDWDKAFSVKAGKHWYSMRSVAGDIVHAMKNAGQFMYVRLNPVYSRTISDFLFRRDPQGRKLSWDQMLLSRPAEQLIPINFANLTREDQTLWESLITSMGAQSRHDVPAYELGKKVREYMASSRDVKMQARAERAEQEIFAPSDYKSIRLALKNGDLDKARSEYRSLMVEKGKNPRDIDQALSPYTASHQPKPYGGLSLTEWTRFKRTLRPYDLQILKDADAERALIYDNFRRMKAGMR